MTAGTANEARRLPTAPVSLRDGIVAAARLAPEDDDTRTALLELLGLQRTEARRPTSVTPPSAAAKEPPQVEPAPNPATPSETAPTPSHSLADPIRARLERAERSHRTRPVWLPDKNTISLATAREAQGAPSVPSLFPELETRALLAAALGTWVEEGEVDVSRLVEHRARSMELVSIPRKELRTLRRGVQLLVDRAPTLAPYAADIEGIANEIKTLLGPSLVERQHFFTCPARGVRAGERSGRAPWRTLGRSMPVLVISAFGVPVSPLEDTGSIEEWERFANEVRAEGHALIGLTPFEPRRWPVRLRELIAFVHWNERASTGLVERVLRETLKGAR